MEFLDIFTTLGFRFLVLALLLLAGAVCACAAQWLRAKAAQTKHDLELQLSGSQRFALDTAIEIAVQAAHQSLRTNDEKFLYVKRFVLNAASQIGIVLSDDEANALIESAVFQLKQLLK